jgi:hypothetical protein
MFDGLLIDYALALIISIAALYSFAQLGGIPRPSVDITHTDEDELRAGRGGVVTPRHFCFWLAWMISQASTRAWSIPRPTSSP